MTVSVVVLALVVAAGIALLIADRVGAEEVYTISVSDDLPNIAAPLPAVAAPVMSAPSPIGVRGQAAEVAA